MQEFFILKLFVFLKTFFLNKIEILALFFKNPANTLCKSSLTTEEHCYFGCKICSVTLLQIHYISKIHYIKYTTLGTSVKELLHNYYKALK